MGKYIEKDKGVFYPSNLDKALSIADELEKSRQGSVVEIVELNMTEAKLRLTYPGLNPKRSGAREIYQVPLINNLARGNRHNR